MIATRCLVLRSDWSFVVEEISTAQDVEAETVAGYFRQWQGDNEKLNAWLAEGQKPVNRSFDETCRLAAAFMRSPSF